MHVGFSDFNGKSAFHFYLEPAVIVQTVTHAPIVMRLYVVMTVGANVEDFLGVSAVSTFSAEAAEGKKWVGRKVYFAM